MGVVSAMLGSPFAVQLLATVVKILAIFALSLNIPPIMVWLERRIPALMQRRRGPNRVGLFGFRLWGLLQSLVDAIKLIFKEEVRPSGAPKGLFHLAPLFNVFPVFLILCAIPFGEPVTIYGHTVPLKVLELNVGFLFILAMTGLGIYGVILSGWASGSKFSLLGSLRASAQMISYEIPLGLSLIPLVLIFDSLDLSEIVAAQSNFWGWGVFVAPISFFIFLICMFAETNRTPFDLAEAESELVVGYHTEFGSSKFALFFLAEYVAMFGLSLLCSVLFFGGWHVPFMSKDYLLQVLSPNMVAAFGVVVLLIKASFFMFLYIWVRWTIPRFRYDQLMGLGWKLLIPVGIANVVVTAGILALGF